MSAVTAASRLPWRQPPADHLDGAANRCQWVPHFVRDDGRHLSETNQGGLLAELFLHLHARAQVVKDAGELALAANGQFADRQANGQHASVFAKRGHITSHADDLRDTRIEIVRQIAVVIVPVGRRHQHADVLADHFGGGITEELFGTEIERFDTPARIDQNDGVDGGIDDRPQALFTLPETCRWRGCAR